MKSGGELKSVLITITLNYLHDCDYNRWHMSPKRTPKSIFGYAKEMGKMTGLEDRMIWSIVWVIIGRQREHFIRAAC